MLTFEQRIARLLASHAGTLGIDSVMVTATQAHKSVNRTGCQTTTELLMLLAHLHADTEDMAGAEKLLAFAEAFAHHEAAIV